MILPSLQDEAVMRIAQTTTMNLEWSKKWVQTTRSYSFILCVYYHSFPPLPIPSLSLTSVIPSQVSCGEWVGLQQGSDSIHPPQCKLSAVFEHTQSITLSFVAWSYTCKCKMTILSQGQGKIPREAFQWLHLSWKFFVKSYLCWLGFVVICILFLYRVSKLLFANNFIISHTTDHSKEQPL